MGPGLQAETRVSEEYHALKNAIDAYFEATGLPDQDDLYRVLGDILAPELRERFKTAYELERPADTPCIRRLITGEEECTCSETRSWVYRELERIGERDEPPHAPPHADHSTLWLDSTGTAAVYSMYVYPGNVAPYYPSETADSAGNPRNGWFDMADWASHWGLDIKFSPISWYYPFSTVQVLFFPPRRY